MIIYKMYLHTKTVQTSKPLIHPITPFIKIIKIFLQIFLILSIIVQLMKVHLVFLTNKMILSITIITNPPRSIKLTIKFLDKHSIKEIY